MAQKAKKPPAPEIKAQIIELGKSGLGNEKIAELIPSVNPNQVAGILFRAKVKRAKKARPPKTVAKKPKLQPKAKAALKAKKEKPAPVASNVVRLPRTVPQEHKIPADDSSVEPRTPAEHAPGTSPVLNRISALQAPLGSKDSPFPVTSEQSKNPDDLTEAEIRAIEKAGYSDK